MKTCGEKKSRGRNVIGEVSQTSAQTLSKPVRLKTSLAVLESFVKNLRQYSTKEIDFFLLAIQFMVAHSTRGPKAGHSKSSAPPARHLRSAVSSAIDGVRRHEFFAPCIKTRSKSSEGSLASACGVNSRAGETSLAKKYLSLSFHLFLISHSPFSMQKTSIGPPGNSRS